MEAVVRQLSSMLGVVETGPDEVAGAAVRRARWAAPVNRIILLTFPTHAVRARLQSANWRSPTGSQVARFFWAQRQILCRGHHLRASFAQLTNDCRQLYFQRLGNTDLSSRVATPLRRE